jgi:hypothetical protein
MQVIFIDAELQFTECKVSKRHTADITKNDLLSGLPDKFAKKSPKM